MIDHRATCGGREEGAGAEGQKNCTRETRTVQFSSVQCRFTEAGCGCGWVCVGCSTSKARGRESRWRVVGGQTDTAHPALLIYAGGDAGASRPTLAARIIVCQDVVIIPTR